jgi:predicted DNA-binding protein YlxM (UPF0122 family)
MNQPNIQPLFLENVRKLLPEHVSFVDEIAEVLHISRDSAYRRIRGETLLSLEEVRVICTHYRISLDMVLATTPDSVTFNHRAINQNTFTLHDWLISIQRNLEMIIQFPQRELIYCAKDIPMFHYFHFPELAAFKLYFWMKEYHRYPQYETNMFSESAVPADMLVIGKRITEIYSDVPSIEIWSDEIANITTRQIDYSLESGFIDEAQARTLYARFLDLLDLLKKYSTEGSKNGQEQNYTLYKNEILIADTTLLFKMGDKRVTFITYNTMNILTTSEETFCGQMENYLNNVMNKSVLVSGTGERDRNKLFHKISEPLRKRLS